MGFRVPLTSATAVNTGDTAGVRIFGNAKNPGSGVVRWYVGGSTTDATLTSSQSGSGGSSWTVTHPGQAGTSSLALASRDLPAGGYEEVATVTAPARLELTTRDVLQTGRARLVPASGTPRDVILAASAYSPGWSMWSAAGYKNLTFSLASDGTVHVEGLVRWTPTATGAAARICAVGVEFLPYASPDGNSHVILDGLANDDGRLYSVEVLGTGVVNVRGTLPGAGFLSITGRYRARDW